MKNASLDADQNEACVQPHLDGAREPPPPLPTPPSTPQCASSDMVTTKAGFKQELAMVEAGLKQATDGMDDEAAGELQVEAARKLRKLLSTDRELLIQEVLERNWVPLLLGWLQLKQRPAVQVEALWALTNIAAGTSEHTHVLIKHGAVPTLIRLLESENDEVLEQAMWVLGNLAGEGASARDSVLSNDALRPLAACLQRKGCSLSMLRIGSWTLSNLCDGQPRPVIDIQVILPILAQLLQNVDAEVLSHTCWALSHLCDGPSSHIKAVVDADVCWRLVQLLMHRSWRVTKPALRTIGNIVCAEDDTDYTQHIIEAGAVPCLRELIAHSNREIQKEACWTLSNIAAGTIEQIQTVLDSGAVPSLVQLASSSLTDAEVKNEACWVVLNATSCGSDLQIEYLVKQGCVSVLSELLCENAMMMMALEGLERILQVGDEEAKRGSGTNPYAALLSTARIEQLEGHKVSAIAKRAARIWKQHFVTCAICNSSYSKHSMDARFCDECKCHVCVNCNCTVFHLSYQEELWREMTDKEASKKQAAAESKRAKKQKKKKKVKEKKQAQAKQTKPPASGAQEDGDSDDARHDAADTERAQRSSTPMDADTPRRAKRRAQNGTGSSTTPRTHTSDSQHQAPTQAQQSTKALRRRVPDGRNPGAQEPRPRGSGPNGSTEPPKTEPTGIPENDDLVSYLQQTGSILALASLLDEAEDTPDGQTPLGLDAAAGTPIGV